MTEEERRDSRMLRVARLLRAWRKRTPSHEQNDSFVSDPAIDQSRADTLDSNDQIRAEAPDDLETIRQADQLEREIKRQPRGEQQPRR
jgi:hypothetical protein